MEKSTAVEINPAEISNPNYQLSIFETVDHTAGKLKEILEEVDINSMTPIECMLKLKELKETLENQEE